MTIYGNGHLMAIAIVFFLGGPWVLCWSGPSTISFAATRSRKITTNMVGDSRADSPTPSLPLHDVWISGAGTLGSIVADVYRLKHPIANIVAETATNYRHAGLFANGIDCRLRDRRSSSDLGTAKNVVISIPPSVSVDYAKEVSAACDIWSGPTHGGKLIFTSSLGVYGDPDGAVVDEKSHVENNNPRSKRLLEAENAVLQKGGKVVRLAGLYTELRGAHTYWMKLAKDGKQIESNSNGLVNLIHYNDAADFVISMLDKDFEEHILIACDDEPISKLDICIAAFESKYFGDSTPIPQFTSAEGPLGKRCNNLHSRSVLGWTPKFPTFKKFMKDLHAPTRG